MPKTKLSPEAAKRMLESAGVDFRKDFHAQGSATVQLLLDVAKMMGYRKSKSAPGSTARMFYQYMERVLPVTHAETRLTPAERRAYQARARRRKKAE